MTLQVGTLLKQRYRVLALLGGGGMGEVYRAVDQKLERSVAIKRLPPAETNQEKRLRFEREARAISQLSHPNICALYDVLDVDDQIYLVMEYLEGENLEERLRAGALPPQQVVEVGLGIAAALAHAHRAGLVHRDLKPANIMLTEAGPKLLDFGVAKSTRRGERGSSDLDVEDLLASGTLTSVGTVLGTVQYMSPEQLQGKTLDGRSDLFSFGAVLYEAASGVKAFDGDTQADWIAAILRTQPQPVRERIETIPEPLSEVIEDLLEKDPERRLESATELIERLRPLAMLTTGSMPAVVTRPRTSGVRRLAVGLAAVAAVALLGLVAWGLGDRAAAPAAELRRIPMSLPDWAPLPIPGAFDHTLALSPDGSLLVWVAEIDGARHLVRRSNESLQTEQIPGTRNARQPFFSPDGEWIGFFTLPGGKLKRVRATPGSTQQPIEIARAPLPLGGAWGQDDRIYYWSEFGVGMQAVAAAGGDVEEVIPLDAPTGELGHAHPQLLPGGRAIVYSSVFGQDVDLARVMVYDFESGERGELVRGAIRPRYLPSGHLVFARKGRLSYGPLDLETLQLGDDVRTLDEPNLASPGSVPVQYAFGLDGSFVYVPVTGNSGRGRTAARVDFEGRLEPLALPEQPYLSARLSPVDGRALVSLEDLLDIWLLDEAGVLREITEHSKLDMSPVWSPDGRSVAFSSSRPTSEGAPEGGLNLFRIELEAGEPATPLTTGTRVLFVEDWSPDGRFLLFNATDPSTGADLYAYELATGAETPLVRTAAAEGNGDISPDGRWLVFAAEEADLPEVFLQEFRPEGEPARSRWQVSVGGGNQPVFSRDGERIFYRRDDSIWSVELRPESDPPISAPQQLFELDFYRHGSEGRSFDVDDEGFLLFIEAPRRGAEMILVQGLLSRLAEAE
ncbi:MAG: hypothetical protein DWQ30_21620 [Acidobacteria bacterium]|nr:MAG: hypothetical protein DWQ30_21620 [Acidobacteriota bacterium]